MAVYTDVSDTELETFLSDFDLGPALSFKGIAEGVENSNFLLETREGRFILTVYERRVRAADLPFFLDLMLWLAARDFPCPSPVAGRDGAPLRRLRGKPAALHGFLPGLSVRTPDARHCREAGAGLARLHLAAEDFPGQRENDLGRAAWGALFAPLAAAAEALEPGLAARIDADLAAIARGWPQDLPRGVIHADFFPDNVFFRAGRFCGAIDFYFAAQDFLAFDLAVALNAWCFDSPGAFAPQKARALIEGYEQRRPLEDSERDALPMLARGAALRFFLTRLADWGAMPPGSLVRPKNPLEYARRLDAHRAGLDFGGAGAA